MLTNKEYVENEGACCPNCGQANLFSYPPIQPTDNITPMPTECMDCYSSWHDTSQLVGYKSLKIGIKDEITDNPPDPKPVVVIEVKSGVASVLECPEWIEVAIVDRDVSPGWAEISRYHLIEMTDLGLTDLEVDVRRKRDNIGKTVAFRILGLISKERKRRDKDV